ncbi:ABC-type multidrug transport system, ATPase and permease component [Bifidobacterium margollesii]|uniref:ABC-type multidrug transport system, ATPase and permease component n=2 Tax=Bifidobacterium margollesii TaxID=2020964 RepID=A0A2N5JB20_9BIFI|nr:ABC-type multidrug transport system, ATPase and permease component [Bifidobacterium margollesii]
MKPKSLPVDSPWHSLSDSSRHAYRWLLGVCGRSAWLVVLLCVLQAGMAAIGVSYALFMRDAIDAAVGRDSARFWFMVMLFGVVLLVQILLRTAYVYVGEFSRSTMDNRLRSTVFSGILRSDAAYASRYHSGELMNRLTSDVTVVSEAVTTLAPVAVSMAIRIVGVIAVMFLLSPTLTGVFVVAGLVMTVFSVLLRGWLKRLHKRVQEAEGRVRSFMQECLESLLVIRSFGVGAKMLDRAGRRMDDHQRARLRRVAVSDLASTGLNFAMQGGYLIGFLWCGYGLLHGTISYGTLMAVIQLIGQIQAPFASLGGMFPQHAAMIASTERLIDTMPRSQTRSAGISGTGSDTADPADTGYGVSGTDSSAEPSDSVPAVPASHADITRLYNGMTALRFDHVHFTYGRNTVLDDCSISIRRGDFVAVTGRSGIGKSTVMKLLLGAYAPQRGTVVLEEGAGPSSRDIPPERIPHGFFAYVPQGNNLMSGSIREVVAFADHDPDPSHVDDDRVQWACGIADASGFIENLPQGYDTVLGERGAGLSEGQMQRLAVARALYSRAPVLLLDESTSALDVDTEHAMLSRIRALRDRTVLIVTHRTEVLEFCDRVIRLGGD